MRCSGTSPASLDDGRRGRSASAAFLTAARAPPASSVRDDRFGAARFFVDGGRVAKDVMSPSSSSASAAGGSAAAGAGGGGGGGGEGAPPRKDKKLRAEHRERTDVIDKAALALAKHEQWLLPEEAGGLEPAPGGVERTWNYRQDALAGELEVSAARKAFDLELPHLGPYSVAFTRNGRHMLMAGDKGHLALLDWQKARLTTEVQVQDTTRDAVTLHNETFFAAAQRKYVYIYDKRGIEVHCLREHTHVTRLDFLQHHFLLVSGSKTGMLRYQDTSTGAIVAQHRTKLGRIDALRQNPHNAVMCVGAYNGTVSMWAPNMGEPLVKMLCHKGAVRALAVDGPGRHLVTAGSDSQVRVWDLRTYKELHSYYAAAPATCLDVSQRGMLAVSWGSRVQIWQDALANKAAAPYMNHRVEGHAVRGVRFCPYDDVLGIGHAGGVSTIVIPGAGEPNFDTFVANPFETTKQRREQEVRQLLDKLQPEMIGLDPDAVGTVMRAPKEVQAERQKASFEADRAARRIAVEKGEKKQKMKGKAKPSKRYRKKQQNVIDEKRMARQEAQELTKLGAGPSGPGGKATSVAAARAAKDAADAPRALGRLFSAKR